MIRCLRPIGSAKCPQCEGIFAGIKYGGEEAWSRCWEIYQKTEVSSERQILLQALGATTDTWLLQRFLLLSLNKNLIRTQDIGAVVWSVASNEDGRHLAWRHIKAYWPNIQTLFGNASAIMSGLITDVVPFFNTEYDYHEVRNRHRSRVERFVQASRRHFRIICLSLSYRSRNSSNTSKSAAVCVS